MRRDVVPMTMALSFLLSVGVVLFFPPQLPAHASSTRTIAAVRKLLRDKEPSKRAAAVRRLGGDASAAALACVWTALSDDHPYVRTAASGVLGLVPRGPGRVWITRKWRKEKHAEVRTSALSAMLLWGTDEALPALIDALGDSSPEMRRGAWRVYMDLATPAKHIPLDRDAQGDAEAMPPRLRRVALAALKDRDGGARAWALRALLADPAEHRGTELALSSSMLAGLLQKDDDPRVRLSALEGSVALGTEMAVVAILRGLTDAVWSVRLRAAELAGATRDRRVLDALPAYLEDDRRRVVRAAHHALVELTGIPFDPHKALWVAWLKGDGKNFDPARSGAARAKKSATKLRKGTVTGERATFLDLTLVSRHVTFVLDRSGSMDEPWAPAAALRSERSARPARKAVAQTRWREVVSRLNQLLQILGREQPTAVVNVIAFGNRAEAMFPRAVPLTAGRIQGIRRWLEKIKPGGRTALYDGIALALEDPIIDNVIVLSDGAPSAGAYFTKTALLRHVRDANHWRRARIDVLAIGAKRVAKRWRDLLIRLAKASGGVCLEVVS